MLTLEAPQFTVRGYTIFRDYTDAQQFYYLPSDRARVSDNGKGIQFVVYTEDIQNEPNFDASIDHAGGFLTLEVELGPDDNEVEQLRSELASAAGAGQAKLAQVPFTDGTVNLFILSQSGSGAAGDPKNFDISIAGSTKPSLFGKQTAVFSVRLGGKAANVLYETLRKSGDPQAVVTYDLEFLALRPAYNLEVTIDFKQTFSYVRNRIGANLLVAAVDIDIMNQEMINEGSISVKEIDYSGHGAEGSPIAGEGGILKLIRDLMAPTLFNTMPIPTPDYRNLPDSASTALQGKSGTNQFLSAGQGGQTVQRPPVIAGTDLKLTHTPPPNAAPGAGIDISVTVEHATGVTIGDVKILSKTHGSSAAFRETPMQATASTGPGGTAVNPGPVTNPGPVANFPPGAGTGSPTAASPPDAPLAAGAKTFTARLPGDANGTTIDYFIRAAGTKAGAPVAQITQTLPVQADSAPLSVTIGAPQGQDSGVNLKVPETDSPLIGYSLRMINETEQVKRTFTLNRTEAVSQHYHPAGALSHDLAGSGFDAEKQITRVALGEGPFKILVIRASAGFDFDAFHLLRATVFITYGQTASGEPQESLTIPLKKDTPSGQVQFFADDQGTQSYSYHVEFTFSPEHLVGGTGQVISSPVFSGVTARSIVVDLDRHCPVIPVEISAGQLRFTDNIIRQVQVRVASAAEAEGRTVIISSSNTSEVINVFPLDTTKPSYFLREEFFFQDVSTVVEKPAMVDRQVVVNEPSDQIFRIAPQYSDPNGLVKEVLLDSFFTHGDGSREQATLHLEPGGPKSEFGIHLHPGDAREWDATPRFVMIAGEPLQGPQQHYGLAEPFVGLTQSQFRIATAMLLEDPSIFSPNDLLAIKVTFGEDLNDTTRPTVSVLLRANRPAGSVIVPGATAGTQVDVAVEFIRHAHGSQKNRTTLAAGESNIYITL